MSVSVLVHVDTAARAARNLTGAAKAEAIRERNSWIAEAKRLGRSSWEIARIAQVSESVVRNARRTAKPVEA